MTNIKQSQLFHQGRHAKLSEKELQWAKTAWQYFKNNTNTQTGVVNSIDKYPTTTMAHIADSIAALVAAHELGLIGSKEFDERLSAMLDFLNSMKLFRNRLPNKVYNTITGAMVDYRNKPNELGWSASDMGRLLIWLRILQQRYPEFHEYVDKAVLRWNFCDVVDQDGSLYGGVVVDGEIKIYQEGRLGYEEYASWGYSAWGFNTRKAIQLEPFELIDIYDVQVYHDARDHRIHSHFAPILTMPYTYLGMEFNWDDVDDRHSLDSVHSHSFMADAAQRIYQVQQRRYQNEKIMTARSEHILRSAPYFLYDSIFAAGYAWNTLSDDGKGYPGLALVSVKAAFSMWVLWSTDYTDALMQVVEELYDPRRGWYEGRYESSGGYERAISSATNAAVLETLLYKQQGKLFNPSVTPLYSQLRMQDFYKHPQKCFPKLYAIEAD